MTERTTYRIAIVDDEPLARQGLLAAVNRITSSGSIALEVVAICENGIDALDAIRRVVPDILLLDIAMPEVDGFAVLERLEPEETPPAVIFVTAYAEHALRAFEAEALDYVVKPVPDARLKGAIDRAVERVNERRATRESLDQSPLVPVEKGRYLRQFVIPERGSHVVVPIDDVEWIEGDTYYARVHAVPKERLLRERLHVLENLLDPAIFMRIHRSAIVRISAIREIRADSPYAFSVGLASGDRAPLSREKRRVLEETLEAGRS